MSVEPRYRRVLNHSEIIPYEYDEVNYTYISSGNGAGKVGTSVYKKDGVTVATLTFTYDSSDRVISQVRT